MYRIIAWKELRETWPVTALAVAAYAWMLASGMNLSILAAFKSTSNPIPFLDQATLKLFAFNLLATAVALALWQTVGENARGTWQVLLHQPRTRRALIGAKLMVGLCICAVLGATPLVIYWWWAATPGTHASPFEASMTVPYWELLLLSLTVYLAAFLCGVRPARWFGTRIFPLLGMWPVALFGMLAIFGGANLGWVIAIIVAVDLMLLATIFFVIRTRDF